MDNVKKQDTILITGATGLIGQALVRYALKEKMSVIAVVRNTEKAKALFYNNANITFMESDVVDIPAENMGVDYIIHAAANTSSRAFVETPVQIIDQTISGTKSVLELARKNNIKSLVYLSSMEVYGIQENENEKIDENHNANLNTMNVRSCYPESKRLCETLCASYAAQYGVPAKVIRLTQTFGPGVRYDDPRVFAEFGRCIIENKNIVLHTKGETKRSYLFTEDAAEAVFTVLLKGISGEAYNAANEETFCSIFEMAQLAAEKCASHRIDVEVKEDNISQYGYAPTLKMNLDVGKLRELGWSANTGLEEMFNRMTEGMRHGSRLYKRQ